MTIINSKDLSSSHNEFDAALKRLETQANALAKVFDVSSETIRKLENTLAASKLNFPLKKNIYKEAPSLMKSPEPRHHDPVRNITHYYTEVWWFLSWESDDISKSYRLFLISEEKEEAWVEYCDGEADGYWIKIDGRILFRKPLLETKVEMRLKVAQYIVPFMNSLTSTLEQYREASLKGEVFLEKTKRQVGDPNTYYKTSPNPATASNNQEPVESNTEMSITKLVDESFLRTTTSSKLRI